MLRNQLRHILARRHHIAIINPIRRPGRIPRPDRKPDRPGTINLTPATPPQPTRHRPRKPVPRHIQPPFTPTKMFPHNPTRNTRQNRPAKPHQPQQTDHTNRTLHHNTTTPARSNIMQR